MTHFVCKAGPMKVQLSTVLPVPSIHWFVRPQAMHMYVLFICCQGWDLRLANVCIRGTRSFPRKHDQAEQSYITLGTAAFTLS